MFVPVMDVRVMRMTVAHPFVAMHVTVRLRQQFWIIVMLMMFVVTMTMFVFQRLVHVFVLVPLRQMQPDADKHKPPGNAKRYSDVLLKKNDCQGCASERSYGKVSSSSRRANLAERQDKQNQAYTVT
jgi:hypothetical protein